VSDTLGRASIRVTEDVYGPLLATSKMKAAEAMETRRRSTTVGSRGLGDKQPGLRPRRAME